MPLPENWDGWARFSASYTKEVRAVAAKKKKKRKLDWVSKKMRAIKVSPAIKKRAARHASALYDRNLNAVVWFDVWEAYVWGSQKW